jgi:hypothetical protein
MRLGPVLLGEGHVGQDVVFGLVHDRRELWHLVADLVCDGAQLGAGGLGGVLREGGGDEGGDDLTETSSVTTSAKTYITL